MASLKFTLTQAYDGVVGGIRRTLEKGDELLDEELAKLIELDQPGTVAVDEQPAVASAKTPDEPVIEAASPVAPIAEAPAAAAAPVGEPSAPIVPAAPTTTTSAPTTTTTTTPAPTEPKAV